MLDASAAVELLRSSRLGHEVARRLEDEAVVVHVPHLLSIEVAQAFRRLALAGTVSHERAVRALRGLADLDAVRHDHELLLPRIWSLRATITAYDAAYVALAEILDAPLLTLDRRLARAPGHMAFVEVLG